MADPTVDCVATENITLSGVQTIDTHPGVATTTSVATVAQTNAAECGVWIQQAGAWTRDTRFDTGAEMVSPIEFAVLYGSPDNAGSKWRFVNDPASPPVVGTDAVDIVRAAWPEAIEADAGLSRSGVHLSVSTTGIAPGDYALGTVNDQGRLLSAFDLALPETFIEGLLLERLSANGVRIKEGSAYIPGLANALHLSSDLDKTGLALTANTWYYLYLFENAGVADVEVVTTAPVTTPYRGRARIKGPDGTPDDTRRWIGAIRCGAAANTMHRFVHRGGQILYGETAASPGDTLQIAAGLTNSASYAGTGTGSFVPNAIRTAWIGFNTNPTSGVLVDLDAEGLSGNGYQAARVANASTLLVPLTSTGAVRTKNVVAGGATDLYVLGYALER